MEKAEFWAMYMNREVSIAHAVDYGLERVHDMNPSSAQYYYTIYQVVGDPTVRLFTAGCPELGRLKLDRTSYSCSATIEIQLRDCSSPDPVTVDINSTSEPTGETVVLSESPLDSGKFIGSIESDTGAPTADGRVQVSHNDTLVVTYYDPNDGEGNPAVVQKTAVVDCVAPTISDVTVGGWVPTVVTFDTDEPACGAVRYGLSCGSLVNTDAGLCMQTSHSIELSGLHSNSTYFYVVDAEDAAGNLSTDTNDGNCYTFTTPAVPDDYFTELFDLGDNDLDNLSITFTPDGSINFYSVCVRPITVLPTRPRGSKRVPLSDDSYRLMPPLVTVSLYGHSYGAGGEGGVYVGSNGYITFGAGDTDYSESLSDHFRLPRISALFDDLDPSSKGAVGVKKLANRVAVTWTRVPEFSTANSNISQIEMFFDGRIRISWLGIDAADGLVGLSEGLGIPPAFTESDLSSYGPCDRSAAQP
jgi:hypothetical protein